MTLFYLLTAIISAAYVLLMLAYLYGWFKTSPLSLDNRSGWEHSSGPGGEATRVSIILPVRNEEKHILNCLSSIFKQKFPSENFEVIVVNDHSADKTLELAGLQKQENLKVISLDTEKQGKKMAITEGILAASGSLIVTTDADCEMGEHWLSGIVSFYEKERPKMIVGPVLLKNENGFQQIMQSQEMTMLTACACGSLHYDQPILCSGANLVYEKDAFLSVIGFDGVNKTASGDDMFLMHKFHEKFPRGIRYLRSNDAVVHTRPERKISDALGQRKRWGSKTFLFGMSHITLIAILIFLTNFLILFSGIMSALNLKFVLIPAVCFFAKSLVDFMLLYSVSVYFKKEFNPFVFVFASVLYPVYVSVLGLVSPFSSYSWKSRKS